MAALERDIAYFRHQIWWQHLGTHGIPNDIIATSTASIGYPNVLIKSWRKTPTSTDWHEKANRATSIILWSFSLC